MRNLFSWLWMGLVVGSILRLYWQIAKHLIEAKKDDEIKEILSALRDLHDEQNGPPLETRREEWQAAMDKAIEILEKYGA